MEPYGFNLSPIFQVNEANDMSADELMDRHVITRYYIKRYLSIQCPASFTINPFNDQWASFPFHTGFPLPRPAYNASKPMIISHDQFRIVVFCMNVCVLQWRKLCIVDL